MILKELGQFYRIQSLTRQQWKEIMKKKETDTKQCVFLLSTLFLVFLALFFDISRMGGAIYETAGRPTGQASQERRRPHRPGFP